MSRFPHLHLETAITEFLLLFAAFMAPIHLVTIDVYMYVGMYFLQQIEWRPLGMVQI